MATATWAILVGAAAILGYMVFQWQTAGNQDTRFEDLPLSKQLRRYHEHLVKLDAQQQKHAKALVHSYIKDIVMRIKGQIDEGKPRGANSCRIEYTGSMYEGTKYGQPDDFDIMIVIDGSQDILSSEVTPGYARLRAIQGPSHRFSRCLDLNGNISPRKMADWFYGLVQKGINQVSNEDHGSVSLSISRHGPAIQVNIQESDGMLIAVDLVLSIQLGPQQLFVAKPFKEYADEKPPRLVYDPAMLWRQSFSVNETRTISSIDGANECRRDCLRILKSIFRREPGLAKFTSYHLKTVLLHECGSQRGSWQISRIDERFMDLLRRIESCLRERSLPHFYMPELNLLDGIRHVTIENMRGRVQRLINSKVQRDRVLHC